MASRRGNKSHKVPGVKLRPAQETRSKVNIPDDDSFMQDDDAEENTQFVDMVFRPFRGLVICATGVPDKTALFKKALELGAMSTQDFTDRVTHLVAATPQGAKYHCAVQRKIPIMKPEWILDSYDIWLHGDDVDVEESMRTHRMPIFTNVTITLSGIDDVGHRAQLQKLVKKEGGSYVKDLTRITKVTHLLCAGDDITDKMRYAEKFNSKEGANIKIVWEEWFWDSLEFGGQFDEEPYRVTHPRPEKRKSSPEPSSPPPSSEPMSETHEAPLQKSNSKTNAPNICQDDEEEEEMAQVKRVHSDTLQIWQSLLKPRGFQIVEGKLLRSPSKSQSRADAVNVLENQMPLREENHLPHKSAAKTGKSILSGFRRSESFAHLQTAGAGPRQPTPLQRVNPVSETGGDRDATEHSPAVSTANAGGKHMFTGAKFKLLGEARAPNVRSAVEDYGGRVLSAEDEDEADFIIVRLISGSNFYKQETDTVERAKYRTECWLERCIYEERVCAPDEKVVFTPLKIDIPVVGADQINLSFSGLEESDACWVRRLVRALGINLALNFSRRSTHLLCPSAIGPKYEKALEWGIPVVGMEWLERIGRSGIIFEVPVSELTGRSENQAIVHVLDVKGKGKAKEVEYAPDLRITDITNSASSTSSNSQSVPRRVATDDVIGRLHEESMAVDVNPPDVFHVEGAGDTFGEPAMLQGHPVKSDHRQQSVHEHAPVTPHCSEDQLMEVPDRNDDQAEDAAKGQTIPSSNTPSPLKNPRSSSMPISPVKPSPTAEATRALQERLTSLLGKRPSEEEETLAGGIVRHGKRVRPPSRSKSCFQRPQSRQNSGELPFPRVASPAPSDPAFNLALARPFDETVLSEENTRPSDESIRVTYEDPAQRAEQRRLMSLLGGVDNQNHTSDEATDDVPANVRPKKRNLVRRSGGTRVAGF
ncbi:hypothetical protein GLOTRDRAFT_78211 [Gloeophyllum trabeum ATCC 11539]|uniref:BRCT domain-containing protein n=1 Tax=Gloeophyllum trabeum (strain ATCC 11539 / FP-39264 / Madison 617) TaxID=670483 RepID=S7Q416_GLOTA|nr:uncharacterized protein GLOTRDRAFT_78211 [Gloeophyllum trabeum ATCC 11539]EPQ54267.1 hypothetical protein GLOTRDRAFT_78211 [Gloeophyllum trabeum ATCC 11539]